MSATQLASVQARYSRDVLYTSEMHTPCRTAGHIPLSCSLKCAWCESCQSVDKEILDVLPKLKEAKNIVGLMDRDTLTFDVALQRTEDEVLLFGTWCPPLLTLLLLPL